MSASAGNKKISNSNIIFGYDVNDVFTSYLGEPTTNVVTNTNLDTGWSKGYTRYALVPDTSVDPPVGVDSPVVSFQNSSTSSTNSYWYSYGNYAPQVPGVTYTISVYARTVGSNFGVRAYTADNSETGRYWGDMQYATGDGNWYRLSWTFTNASDSQSDSLSFNLDVPINQRVWLCAPMMEANTHKTKYVVGSRSATNSLKDITQNITIDVSNASFDSDSKLCLDGTNDVILTDFPAQTISDVSIEAVFYNTITEGRYRSIVQNNTVSDDALYIYPGGYIGFWPCTPSTLPVTNFTWNHVIVTYTSGVLKYYLNGIEQTYLTTCGDITDWDFLRIGGHSTGDGERFGGYIDVVKLYNTNLSRREAIRNFKTYAKRYNIDILDGSTEAKAAPSAKYLLDLGITGDGVYWIKPIGGSIATATYCDMTNGGWMMVASNNANSTLIPGGTARNNVDYTLTRNGANWLGVADPNADFIYGVSLSGLEFNEVRILGFGLGSTNGTYSYPNYLGPYITAEWSLTTSGNARFTEKVARANVTFGGDRSTHPNASYFILDAVANDISFNANSNQSTIGGAGVLSSNGDPSEGCYLGHGLDEGSYEGWYTPDGNRYNSQGYTTWVR